MSEKRVVIYSGPLDSEADVFQMPHDGERAEIEVNLVVENEIADPSDYKIEAFFETGSVVIETPNEIPENNDCKVVLVYKEDQGNGEKSRVLNEEQEEKEEQAEEVISRGID